MCVHVCACVRADSGTPLAKATCKGYKVGDQMRVIIIQGFRNYSSKYSNLVTCWLLNHIQDVVPNWQYSTIYMYLYTTSA